MIFYINLFEEGEEEKKKKPSFLKHLALVAGGVLAYKGAKAAYKSWQKDDEQKSDSPDIDNSAWEE